VGFEPVTTCITAPLATTGLPHCRVRADLAEMLHIIDPILTLAQVGSVGLTNIVESIECRAMALNSRIWTIDSQLWISDS
jgi:hypothetical protein